MPANALIQTRIDPKVKQRATEVLETMGLTVSDAVRILLTRTANEGALPFPLTQDTEAYDRWFKKKVQQALEDKRPPVPHSEVEQYFKKRRTAAQPPEPNKKLSERSNQIQRRRTREALG